MAAVYMDSVLYRAAISGNINVLRENKANLGKLTPSKCTVLHLASHSGKAECVQEIIKLLPSLLPLSNSKWETPLHLAAKQGHLDVVKALLDGAKTLPEDHNSGRLQFMRKTSWYGYTALHEAVRYNRLEVVKVLVEEDKSDKHEYSMTETTPLYVAACRGYLELVIAISKTCLAPSYSGPHDRTALHGAVINGREECVEFLLGWKKNMIAKTDEYGRTAFHYAAYHQSPQMMKHLLEADKSFAYVRDEIKKRTALHIAANQGNTKVVKELVESCPECCDMVDSRRRNVLHIAVELENKEMIGYLLQNIPIMIGLLLDQKDEDENTPLHLLAMSRSGFRVPEILQHNMADKEELNKKTLSPEDFFYWDDKPLAEQTDVRKTLEGSTSNGTWNSRRAIREDEELDKKANRTKQAEIKAIAEKETERLQKMCDTHMLVATLIATVSFAAGFTMPGGVDQDKGPNQGRAIHAKNAAFKAFMVTDTLGLLFSTASLVIYFIAAIYKEEEDIQSYILNAMQFNIVAIIAMMLAFITGTYAALPHPSALGIVLCVIGCSFFVVFFYILKKVIRRWLKILIF